MNYTRHVLSAGLLLLFAQGTAAHAQIETLRTRTAIASPDSTIDKLTKRVEALESTVAALQQKLAFIKSVSPLVLAAPSESGCSGFTSICTCCLMRLPSVRTMPTSQMRSPNQGERPVVSRSKKAKRALERSNIINR